MHTLSKLAATLVAGALLSLPAIAADKAPAAPAKSGTVATVNGAPISQSLFDAAGEAVEHDQAQAAEVRLFLAGEIDERIDHRGHHQHHGDAVSSRQFDHRHDVAFDLRERRLLWTHAEPTDFVETLGRIPAVAHGVVYVASTHGVRAFRAADGTLLRATKYVTTDWAEKIDLKTGRPIKVREHSPYEVGRNVSTCPSAMGGKDQQPASVDPKEPNLFYVPTNNWCMELEPQERTHTNQGTVYVFANVYMYPEKPGTTGVLRKYDVVAGKDVWSIPDPYPNWGGTMNTDGGLVFYGSLGGDFRAVDRKSGKILWSRKLGSGIIGNPGEPAEGFIILRIGKMWYSHSDVVEEKAIFVHPDFRAAKGGRAKKLAEFGKSVADKQGLPLIIGVLSNHRTKGKIRMYERLFGEPAGAFFLYNAQTGDFGKET